MKSSLEKAGYQFNTDLGIWITHEYEGIAYSDGDEVEQRIAHVVNSASDVSVLSEELKQNCIDWPSIYHLDSRRANLVRPFQHLLQSADVLEIGAGCGAITRYLGEANANVLALEGSPRRAAIARSRTRDLKNVMVVSETFDNFKCDHKFDVITLIGVLEYAGKYSSSDQPHLQMLERARQFLKPNGRLIIAIENQLGLKYFAGSPEDHLGESMYGIEGRYQSGQPKTFGREVIVDIFKSSGFNCIEQLVPFPDYKLPISIVTKQGFEEKHFDASVFACQSIGKDPQMPKDQYFSMMLAYPEIIKNNLAMEMANSFLFILSPSKRTCIDNSLLAYHYNYERLPQYCTEKIFFSGAGGKINVGTKRVTNEKKLTSQDILLHSIDEQQSYVIGKSFSNFFIDIVTTHGLESKNIFNYFKRYIEILKKIGAFDIEQSVKLRVSMEISGEYFDAVPENIIIASDGAANFVDREWILNEPVDLGYLLFRAIISLVNLLPFIGHSKLSDDKLSVLSFVSLVFKNLDLPLTRAALNNYAKKEATIQEFVTGIPKSKFKVWNPSFVLQRRSARQMLESFDSLVTD